MGAGVAEEAGVGDNEVWPPPYPHGKLTLQQAKSPPVVGAVVSENATKHAAPTTPQRP